MTFSDTIEEHERKYHGVTPEPEPPGGGPSGIAVPGVKAGWQRVGFSHFDDDIALGSWTGDRQGTLDGRPTGDDTSKRGKYSNVKCMSQHDSLLDCRMFQDGTGQRWMGCPKNLAGLTADGKGVPNLRVTECMKITGAGAGWKMAHMVAKFGAVRSQEFDYPEGQLSSGNASAFVHAMGNDKRYPLPDGILKGWHTYTTERVANQYVLFELDGQRIGLWEDGVNSDGVHWIGQNETVIGGTLPAVMGEAHVLLDWITIEVR